MIDINIFELLSTIGIGTVAMISLLYCYFISLKLFNARKHNSEAFITWVKNYLREEYKQSGYTLITSVLIFSLGVMTEDFTDHLADSETSRNPIVSTLKSFELLRSEGELRRQTLVVNDTSLSGLGKEIFNNKKINSDTNQLKNNNYFFNTGNASEYWKEKGSSILNDANRLKSFNSFVNRIYYTAKNWCYLKSEPARKELEEIQTRIDLARSLSLISFFSLILVIILYSGYYINELLLKKKNKFTIVNTTISDGVERTFPERKVFYPFRAIIVLLLIFLVTKLCYEVAENNFNERAFGYYISYLKFTDN